MILIPQAPFNAHNLLLRDPAFSPGNALRHALHLRNTLATKRAFSPVTLNTICMPLARLFKKMGNSDWLNEEQTYLLSCASPEARMRFFDERIAPILRPVFDAALVRSVTEGPPSSIADFLKQQNRIALPLNQLRHFIQADLLTLAGAATFLTGTLQQIDHLADLKRKEAKPHFDRGKFVTALFLAPALTLAAGLSSPAALISFLGIFCFFPVNHLFSRLKFSYSDGKRLKLDPAASTIQAQARETLESLRSLHQQNLLQGYLPQQTLIPTMKISAGTSCISFSLSPDMIEEHYPHLVNGGLYLRKTPPPQN